MKNNYQICIIQPEGYVHSHAFDEIALLLKYSFESLGFPCEIVVNDLNKDKVNILLGFHLASYFDGLKEHRYIPYQLEQLDVKEGWYNENIKKLLENAFEVWDYSENNIEFLEKLGIKAKHLPIGYHEKLENIKHPDIKDIDVLFYGSVNERRKSILEKLADINLKVLFGVYGNERDSYITRSKIILNVHYYSAQILEAVRISYLLNNKCFIITEESKINPYEDVSLVTVPYDKIAETCAYYLKNPKLIDNKAINNYEKFKTRHNMVKYLKQVLL